VAAQRSSISPLASVKWVRRRVDVRGVDGESEGAAAADAAGQGLFHRRRHQRVKRRFACEFLAAGQRYRGIVVELSSSGLFVQTDATTTPGSEIDLHLAGAGAVPDLVVRAVVVRRRMVPAPLAAAVRRGIALEILEAPREYGLACGSELLDAPIRLSRRGGGISGIGSAETRPQEPEVRAETATTGPDAPLPPAPAQRTESPPLQDSGAPGPPRPDVLVVDDGTLGDVDALLHELGADARRLCLRAADGAPPFLWPRRLFITTARLACSLYLPEPGDEDDVVAIAVAEDESQTLSTMMQRLGFQYLVHRPIHPEAMRLLLRKVLYRGAEHRRAERLPFGTEVTWRTGWVRKRGILVEISSTGCRLQADRPLRPGSRIRIAIPPEATGDRRIPLRGRIVRRDAASTVSSETRHALAVVFDPLPTRVQRRLDALLVRLARGPATLARGAPAPAPAAAVPPARAIEGEAPAAAPPPVADRRRVPRVRLDREIVSLDETATQALHALVGRDLSPRGMRIDPHPDLALNQRLRLALYEPSVSGPVVLEAEVARDDGGAGLALRFVDVPPDVTAQLGQIVAALPALERLRPEPQRIWLGDFSSEAAALQGLGRATR